LRRALACLASSETPNESVEKLFSRHNAKVGRRKELYKLRSTNGDTPDYLLKVNRYPSNRRILGRQRISKARHQMAVAEQLAQRGLATPLPLAAGDQHEGGRLAASLLLVPILDDAVDLLQLWLNGELTMVEKHALARDLGSYVRRMHDAGLFQDDFAPSNFLVRRGDPMELFAIDFERAVIRSGTSDRARRWMIGKLDCGMARTSTTDRMRFLRHYAASDRDKTRYWWQTVSALAPHLARRDVRRMHANARRGGGRFRSIASNRCTGYARIDVSDATLEHALANLDVGEGVRVSSGDSVWITPLVQTSSRQLGRAWATASALALRGLCPSPLGAVRYDSQAFLLLQRNGKASLLTDAQSDDATQGALRALFERLFGYGDVGDTLDAEGIVVEPTSGGRVRAFLLNVQCFHFGSTNVRTTAGRVTNTVVRLMKDLRKR
jgi:hypothetical protein